MAYPDCKHRANSSCTLGLYGGKPTGVECNACDQYQGRPRGIGDMVQKVTEKTGIKAVVEKVTGGGCGCNKRRDKLNKLVPFRGEQ